MLEALQLWDIEQALISADLLQDHLISSDDLGKSQRAKGWVCPYCYEPVFLKPGHTRQVNDKSVPVRAAFCHYKLKNNSLNTCDIRSKSQTQYDLDQLKLKISKGRKQKLKLFETSCGRNLIYQELLAFRDVDFFYPAYDLKIGKKIVQTHIKNYKKFKSYLKSNSEVAFLQNAYEGSQILCQYLQSNQQARNDFLEGFRMVACDLSMIRQEFLKAVPPVDLQEYQACVDKTERVFNQESVYTAEGVDSFFKFLVESSLKKEFLSFLDRKILSYPEDAQEVIMELFLDMSTHMSGCFDFLLKQKSLEGWISHQQMQQFNAEPSLYFFPQILRSNQDYVDNLILAADYLQFILSPGRDELLQELLTAMVYTTYKCSRLSSRTLINMLKTPEIALAQLNCSFPCSIAIYFLCLDWKRIASKMQKGLYEPKKRAKGFQ